MVAVMVKEDVGGECRDVEERWLKRSCDGII